MKILSAKEIRDWDQYTILNEPIASIDLMERAASRCVDWLISFYPDAESFGIFCGNGNNGGDGLAIARLLIQKKYKVITHILEFGHKGTMDFQNNLERLHQVPGADIHFIQTKENIHSIPSKQVIIDAFFGSGLNRGLEGITAQLVAVINESGNDVVSIDIPSGLFTDRSSKGQAAIQAAHTLSFQCYKPAFLFAENQDAIGQVHILSIGLLPEYFQTLKNRFELIDESLVKPVHKPRKSFAHKGNFGHALLLAGSHGKMGAAVLAAKACLRSGAGLLTCHIPQCGYEIMQGSVPEAMVTTDSQAFYLSHIKETDLSRFDVIGIGPGIGTLPDTKTILREILDAYRSPLVIDADALNIIASQKDMLKLIPPGSILTPHPKEFERLFGESANDFDRAALALQKANEGNFVIILKGHHTFIATPDGQGRPASSTGTGFFNSTGNPGMATAGSGDVLSGILTGLMAQGYSSAESAILGVYLHGLAGDIAANTLSEESMIASDIIHFLGTAFRKLAD